MWEKGSGRAGILTGKTQTLESPYTEEVEQFLEPEIPNGPQRKSTNLRGVLYAKDYGWN